MYKICIVDPNKDSCAALENMIAEFGIERNIRFSVSKFKSAEECLEAQGAYGAIMFTEIALPDMDGLTFANRINNDSVVIFCSALTKYAVEGYVVSATGFLVKPFSKSLFRKTLEKALNQFENKYVAGLHPVWKVIYVEVRQHYLYYHLSSSGGIPGGIVRMRGTMRGAEERFSDYGFVRCSNSYLVNLNYVKCVKGNSVLVSEVEEVLGLSANCKKNFINSLKSFFN